MPAGDRIWQMKTPDTFSIVLGVPAAAWYLFSADTPEEFLLHLLHVVGLAALIWFLSTRVTPPSLIEQEFGPLEKRD